MNKPTPTHEDITRRAEEIWNARGRPSGQDDEIWFEAEQQLAASALAANAPSEVQGRGNGNSQTEGAATPAPGGASPSLEPTENSAHVASPGETSAKAAQQKKGARAPKTPAKVAPKTPPSASGKPLWDKPHSS